LSHEKHPEQDEDEDRKPREKVREPWVTVGILDGYDDILFPQNFDEVIVLRRRDTFESLSIREISLELTARDRHLVDISLLDLVHEIGEIYFPFDCTRRLEKGVQDDDDDPGCDPENNASV